MNIEVSSQKINGRLASAEDTADSDLRVEVLDELARQIRTGLALARRERCNAVHHDLDVGDAVIAAQKRVSGNWKRWLKDNCFLSVRTAFLYMQLARSRDAIEAEIERVGELSLRAAVRLLTKPKVEASNASESTVQEPDPVASVVAALKALTNTQLTAVWTAFTLPPFLRTINADMRLELERRIAGLRSTTKGAGPVLLRESEILRNAVSHMRTAAALNAAAGDIKRAEDQALLALRMFTKVLGQIDIDRITITDVYAKAARCAENKRSTKKARRAA